MSEFAEFLAPRAPRLTPYSPAALHVRPAIDTDLDVLAGICARREGRTPAEMRPGFTRALEEFAAERALLLVAEHDGAVIGYGKAAVLSFVDAEEPAPPAGWYLTGLVVEPAHRRRGVGARLTEARLEELAAWTSSVHYVASAENPVTIALHRQLGFVEVARCMPFPGVEFTGGVGILFRCDLPSRRFCAPR